MDYKEILAQTEQAVLHLLQKNGQNIVQGLSLQSTRAVGDAVQMFLSEQNGLKQCIPLSALKTFESEFERRSMEDMAFYDNENRYYAVDCKTHNLSTDFNMPNLISVRRIANFYKNELNFFCILIVEYDIESNRIKYKSCHFKPIEAFSWDCLTIGALGWGQIQIANANVLKFNRKPNRKEWMLQLCDKLDAFYDEEIGKIGERKTWFNEIRDFWNKK